MENVKRNKQLKIGFVGFFFLFFLEQLLKCKKFKITFFPRKNTISSLGAVQACSHLFSLFIRLFLREGEEMERMKDGRKEGGRKEVKEKEK